jgi:DNA mismatch repair protein MutS
VHQRYPKRRSPDSSAALRQGRVAAATSFSRLADDLPLFSAACRRAEPAPHEPAAEALLRETRLDELTPRQALDLVYRLKGLIAE